MTKSNQSRNLQFRESNGNYCDEMDLEDPSTSLYTYQHSLPRLPVPDLKETCKLYLKTVQPLVSTIEFEKTKQYIEEFLQPGGMGEILQKRLLERARDRSTSSWLAEWWNTLGYLQVRDPVVFNVSYFFHFSDSIHPTQQSQIGRAASLLRASLLFREQIITGSLSPEQIGTKKIPLCATAYKYMFNTCRIPQLEQDSYRIYEPFQHQHVIIIRHHKFFRLNIIENGTILSFDEICFQLQRIIDTAGTKELSIGSLSSSDRNVWAKNRKILIDEGNEEALKEIESAILIICLDDKSPISRQEMSRVLWHGNCNNRFYDKCIQLIVCENGKAGLLAEHSMLDGMPMLVYADYIIKGLYYKSIDLGDRKGTNCLPFPQKIQFHVTSSMVKTIEHIEKIFQKTVNSYDVRVVSFFGYGKNDMKTFQCSPDAFAQMAIQLAYMKMFGHNCATYEATQVRKYLHGRTETTRSCSNESKQWTLSMLIKDNKGRPTKEKVDLLRKAITSHVRYMNMAAQGKGVDRHLLGLQLCLHPNEQSSLFMDPSYQRSKHWNLSTSHLTHALFDGWGWGPVVMDGLGIAYMIKEDSVHFNVATFKKWNWATPFCHLLEESLLEMKQLFLFEASLHSKMQSHL